MLISLIMVFFGLAVLWFLLPFGVRKLSERRLSSRCRDRKCIALTYDDGPSPTITPRLLELLSRETVPATFFALGKSIEVAPEIMADILQHGHEVGSHTYRHSNAWKTWPQTYQKDMAAGVAVVSTAGGDGTFFRPPYGKLTVLALIIATVKGVKLGWWTVDSQDSWNKRDIDDVVEEVIGRGGGVVLMHDLDGYDAGAHPDDHLKYVLELTEKLILRGRREGFEFVTLGKVV